MNLQTFINDYLCEIQFISLTGRTTEKPIKESKILCKKLKILLQHEREQNNYLLSNAKVLKTYSYLYNNDIIVNIYIDI